MPGNSLSIVRAKKILKTVFGYDSFRDNQKEVISAILSGRDVFTSMPTGGGKSLCYQIPAVMFEGLTVVISPLIALMKDQVDDAVSKGIAASFLNSSLESKEITEIYARLHRNEIKLLYISPERLAIDGYLQWLQTLNISFFAIDEAHCLSEWGHDFRPDYLSLAQIRDAFPTVPLAGFTATATQQVQDDIIRILKMRDPLTVRASFNRKELYYEVRQKTEILSQIADFIKLHSEESGIVYRISRKDVEKTAAYLKTQGIKALYYHAGLSREERAKNQDLFNNDKADVIVATIAFGMGIDKSNIRYVIHGDLSKNMEGYYQETGRAGRDGLASDCIMFFGAGDVARQQYFIEQIEDPAEQEKAKASLNRIVRFATVQVCRRKQILEYFGEAHEGNCKSCDVCNNVSKKVEATQDARMILSAMARTNEGFGAGHIIDIVWGADTEKVRSNNHQALKTFSVGKDKPKKWWRGIVEEMIGQQIVYQDSERFNILRMTASGRKVLLGQELFYVSEATVATKKEIPGKNHGSDFLGFTDEVLLKKLKHVRSELAQEHKVPPYIIFSDKTLTEMAGLKPETSSQFLSVSGVGEKKLEAYGSYFLQAIKEYNKEA
ncbi:DNA helicase RecQ [Sphaerochaeta pleomorpha]|uniref:DNA helicase RecQ n=1 Tax=Sphaerochaeta pleomorpha TaxID=1131707 RepID=UPI0002D6BE56|nr:DNA helicase RecQ [Sphaerochaeta pleomorpha]